MAPYDKHYWYNSRIGSFVTNLDGDQFIQKQLRGRGIVLLGNVSTFFNGVVEQSRLFLTPVTVMVSLDDEFLTVSFITPKKRETLVVVCILIHVPTQAI